MVSSVASLLGLELMSSLSTFLPLAHLSAPGPSSHEVTYYTVVMASFSLNRLSGSFSNADKRKC